MNLAAIHHEPKSSQSYLYDEENLHIRLQTARGDLDQVTLLAVDPYNWAPDKEDPCIYRFAEETIKEFRMEKEATTALHDVWFANVSGFFWHRVRYAFVLESEGKKVLYHSRGFSDLERFPQKAKDSLIFFNFPYMNAEDMYRAPEWVKDTVWYQIFPDRFARGSDMAAADELCPWGETERFGYHKRYGGNLKGILEHLDYIESLGVNGIYLTPVFCASSIHKYDVIDYERVDADFGDNEMLGALIREAHRRGIRVMLDAVFNHCSASHPFWQDVLQKGKDSEYYNCFYILNEESSVQMPKENDTLDPWDVKRLNYRTFAFEPGMPKWNTNHAKVREYFLRAAAYWMEQYHVDAWRLDVSNEISHDFWRAFRKHVKAIDRDCYILGENWDYSYPWLRGDQMDGVMNYGFLNLVWNFVGLSEEKKEDMSVSAFCEAVDGLLTDYPRNVILNLFTLLDSHDTSRILSVCKGQCEPAMLAYILLLTMNGSPCIYYGDEIGLEGTGDANRKCMLWEEEKQNSRLLFHIRRMIEIRKNCACCRNGTVEWLDQEDEKGVLLYRKRFGKETLLVCLHNAPAREAVTLPASVQGKKLYEIYREEYMQLDEIWDADAYAFLIFLESKDGEADG